MTTNTKFPNRHLPFNNKFGVVLPQVHNVIKPNQVPNDKPVEEEKEKERVFTDLIGEDNDFNIYADMSFYSKEDILKYENSPIQNKPSATTPQGLFDVYRYLKK